MKASTLTTTRFELFHKSPSELKTLTGFLKSQGIHRVNITNKDKTDQNDQTVRTLCHELGPSAHICVHYSIKYNPVNARQKDPTQDAATHFIESCKNLAAAADEADAPGAVDHVLIISGGGPKKKVNTVSLLEAIRRSALPPPLPIYVAFNPYLPFPEDLETEKQRLVAKLSSGLVSGVYLQMGTDLARLRAGLECLREAARAAGFVGGIGGEGAAAAAGTVLGAKRPRSSEERLPVFGSIFLPTPQLLAQMKFRPWNGVFLSDRYLGGVAEAEKISREILDTYREFGVIPLVESRVQKREQLEHAERLLSYY